MRNRLTLYGRAWCHLCEDMRLALLPLQAEFGFDLEILDVDADPSLEQRYGDRVPVLMVMDGQEEVELCHYHLDSAGLRRHLA